MAGGKKGKQQAEADEAGGSGGAPAIDVDRLRRLTLEMIDVLNAAGDEDTAEATAKAKAKTKATTKAKAKDKGKAYVWKGPTSGPGWGRPANFDAEFEASHNGPYLMVQVRGVKEGTKKGYYDARDNASEKGCIWMRAGDDDDGPFTVRMTPTGACAPHRCRPAPPVPARLPARPPTPNPRLPTPHLLVQSTRRRSST
jgi:hypothetical protein